jgi:hypothetical protein
MNTTIQFNSPALINDLLDHIHERTFGRLHDLNISISDDGRFVVTAIAHSRFVRQLAEWAVLERLSAEDVRLSIALSIPSRHFMEVER